MATTCIHVLTVMSPSGHGSRLAEVGMLSPLNSAIDIDPSEEVPRLATSAMAASASGVVCVPQPSRPSLGQRSAGCARMTGRETRVERRVLRRTMSAVEKEVWTGESAYVDGEVAIALYF